MYEMLNKLRVIECASFIAAPSCALHMLQFGAEVVRIDPIGGGPDFNRWPLTDKGDSLYWEGLNKGKRSVAVDLSSPDGRRLVHELITAPGENAGLFVTNFPEKGFLAHDKLRERREDLITVRVAGWSDGESGVDYTINAALGVPYMTGGEKNEGQPVNHVLPAWDLLTGTYAAFSLLAAERHRRFTGQGQELIVPLSDMALASMGHMGQIAEVLTSGQDRPRMGNDLYGAFGRDFQTRDGRHVMLVAISHRQWTNVLEALELVSAVADLEKSLNVSFATDEGIRFQHRGELFPMFERAIAALDFEQVSTLFKKHRVCWSPYYTLHEALHKEPRYSPSGPMFTELEHPSGLSYPAPGPAARSSDIPRKPLTRAPYLGEHTDQVLTEILDMSATEIGRLHDAGVIAST